MNHRSINCWCELLFVLPGDALLAIARGSRANLTLGKGRRPTTQKRHCRLKFDAPLRHFVDIL
jgi:hypothetical protein